MATFVTVTRPYIFYTSAAVTSAGFGANAVTLVSASAHGSDTHQHIEVWSNNLDAGLALCGAYCTTAGVVVARILNPTASTISAGPTLQFMAR